MPRVGNLRRGRRARGEACACLRPGAAGRDARAGERGLHGQALPRRGSAAGRRGSSLSLRTRAGVSGPQLRLSPDPVRGGDCRRGGAGHALLRDAGRHRARRGRVRVQPRRDHGAAARALRLRRRRLLGLGPAQRHHDRGRAVPRPGLGRRASDHARTGLQGPPGRRGPVRRRGVPRGHRRPRALRPGRRGTDRRLRATPAPRQVPPRPLRRSVRRSARLPPRSSVRPTSGSAAAVPRRARSSC